MKKDQTSLSFYVAVIIWELDILENQVAKIAEQSCNQRNRYHKIPAGYRAFDTSSLEVYVKTGISLSGNGRITNIDLLSNFLFTSIKIKGKTYCPQWSNSLS